MMITVQEGIWGIHTYGEQLISDLNANSSGLQVT